MERLVRLGGVLALAGVLGWAVIAVTPGDDSVAGWPVGLVTGLLIWTPRRHWWPAGCAALAVVALSVWAGGGPLSLGLGAGLVVLGQAVAGAWHLRREPGGASLVTGAQGARFARAGLVSLTIAVAGGVLLALLTGHGTVFSMALGLAVTTFVSHLALVPWFLRVSSHPALFTPGERMLHWAAVALAMGLIFWGAEPLPLLFVIIPVLIIAAARGTVREVQAQVLMCGLIAGVLTYAGHGPLAAVQDSYAHPAWVVQLVLMLFVGVCAVTTLPFAVTTGLERVSRQAALEENQVAQRLVKARLHEIDRVQDGFVANVSHELRTPITNIVGYLELLEDGAFGDLSDGQTQAVSRVTQNSARLLQLIDDLLTLVRAQEDHGAELRDEVDVREVVASAQARVERALEGRDLIVEVRLADEPLVVRGDHDKLERVMMSLADNAVKFTPDGGSIRIRAERLPEGVQLTVADTGLGIPPEEQGLLFTRFFRSSIAEAHAIQGTGLGLSIAATIVELHGGTIDATSAPGEGSTFRVLLPAV